MKCKMQPFDYTRPRSKGKSRTQQQTHYKGYADVFFSHSLQCISAHNLYMSRAVYFIPENFICYSIYSVFSVPRFIWEWFSRHIRYYAGDLNRWLIETQRKSVVLVRTYGTLCVSRLVFYPSSRMHFHFGGRWSCIGTHTHTHGRTWLYFIK